MIIKRSITLSIRINPSFEDRWDKEDKGLITAWEVGREKAKENPELKRAVQNGELPVLGYYGGHEKRLQASNFKYGSYYYYAQLQGLKEEDLDVDTDMLEGLKLNCSKTNMNTILQMIQVYIKDKKWD